MPILKEKKILISGQVLNSLTEMAEDYLKDKAVSLGVIGIANPYATPGSARETYYRNGALIYNRQIPNIYFHRQKKHLLYLYIPAFMVYFYSIFRSAYRFKVKFDIFVGISCFSAFSGLILKRFGIVKKVIYYSIDYFPLKHQDKFEYLMGRLFFMMDRFCAKHSDLVWHINPDIAQARLIYGGMKPELYRSINVPLGYGEDLFNIRPFSEIERYALGFVGTLNPNQGLQMVVGAFPEILNRFPQAKLEIIGDGVFANELKKMADESGVRHRIVFHGFIGDRKKVSQILSRCALGIATWTMDADNNIRYADPGKPKHYAFCGLPVIITKSNHIAYEIDKLNAGIAINYDKSEFIEAVTKLIEDEKRLQEYRENAFCFAHRYISANIYEKAWDETLRILEMRHE